MKSWWLNLYTIPFLKRLVLAYGAALLILWIGFNFFESKALLFSGGFLLPLICFFSSSTDGMIANLDFHKMSVPMKELRLAFYLDMAIQILSFLILGSMSFAIIYFGFASPQSAPIAWLLVASAPSFYLMSAFTLLTFLVSVKTMKMKVQLRKQQEKMDTSSKKKRFILLGLGVAIQMIFFDTEPGNKSVFPGEEYLEQFNLFFIVGTLVSAFMFANNFNFSKIAFNIIRLNENKRKSMNWLAASAIGVVFCLFCGFIFRFEINSNLYSVGSKYKSMFLFSDFLPEIEVETARELSAAGPTFAEEIFKNADPAIYEMPVEDFIKKKDVHAYTEYLKHGKPSSRNIVYIMKEIESHPDAKDWGHSYYYRDLKYRLVQHHPDAKSLPDSLIKEKIQTKKKREVASKKEEEKDP